MVTTKDFKVGEVILKEKPLVYGPSDIDVSTLKPEDKIPAGDLRHVAAFLKASPEDRATVLSQFHIPNIDDFDGTVAAKVGAVVADPCGVRRWHMHGMWKKPCRQHAPFANVCSHGARIGK